MAGLRPSKLTAPAPSNIYPRQRLFERLDDLRQHGIVWICGPPGSGKTTLAASYLQAGPLPTLWFQIDENDADPASFFADLILALPPDLVSEQTPFPPLTSESLAALPAYSRRFFRVMAERIGQPFVLVLDDVHVLAADESFQRMLSAGLATLPQAASVLVLSRVKPPAPWTPLLVKERLAQLNWDDLRLTPDETASIAQMRSGSALNAQAISTLHQRTDGWMAGLILLLQQGVSQPDAPLDIQDSASAQVLFDYFTEEIWRVLSDPEQSVLLQAALLPGINESILAELTEQADAIEIVKKLAQQQFFTLQITPQEYRFHPLLHEFLINHGKQRFSAMDYNTRLTSTADALLAHGQHSAAAELFIQASAWPRLSELICTQASALLAQSRYTTLHEWLMALPEPVRQQNPWLLLWQGAVQMLFNPPQALPSLKQAYQGFLSAESENPMPRLITIAGILDTIWLAQNDYREATPYFKDLERLTAGWRQFPSLELEARLLASTIYIHSCLEPMHPQMENWLARGNKLLYANIPEAQRMMLACALVVEALFNGHPAQCESAINSVRKQSESPLLQSILFQLFELITLWALGRHEEVLLRIQQGAAPIRELASTHLASEWQKTAVFAHLSLGDFQAAGEQLENSFTGLNQLGSAARANHYSLAAWQALQAGNNSQGLEYIRVAQEASRQSGLVWTEALSYLALAQAHVLSNDYAAAKQALQQSYGFSSYAINYHQKFLSAMLEAYIALAEQREADARRHLQDGLSAGQSQNLLSILYWLPAMMRPLCNTALRDGIEVDYVQALIRSHRLPPDDESQTLENWPWPVRIYTLGRFAIELDGELLSFKGKAKHRLLDVLKALMALGGQDVHQDRLIEAVWPDAEGDAGRRNFDTGLHRLRKLLGSTDALLLSEGRLSLNPARVWLDCRAFEHTAQALQHSLQNGTAVESLQAQTERLLQYYQGPFCKNGAEEFWLLGPRQRWQDRFTALMTDLVDYYTEQHKPDLAIHCCQAGLERAPNAANLYQPMIRHYLTQAEPDKALTAHRQYVNTCQRAGLQPSPEIATMVQNL